MHIHLVRVYIWTNKVLKSREALVICTLTTLALDTILTRNALRKCASQTMQCHSSSLSLSLCINNIIMLVVLLILLFMSCRFIFQSPFLSSSFFFSWFLYGEEVRIVSDSEFIFYWNTCILWWWCFKNFLSRSHILWEMWGGKVIKVMPWAWAPLIASCVLWLWWRSSILTRSPWLHLLCSWMFQSELKHLCIRPPLTSGVTHWLWRSNTPSKYFHIFSCNRNISGIYGPAALISSMFQIHASSKVSSSRLYLSTSKTFQPIYISHPCALAKTMVDILFSYARCITSTVFKPYISPFLSWGRETCASSMFIDNTVLQRPGCTTPWSGQQ